jgi:hypothetical protein
MAIFADSHRHERIAGPGVSGRTWHAGADANWRRNRETSNVAIFFALAGPKAIFMIRPGKFTARGSDAALRAQLTGACFATRTGLGSFGLWWEEKGSATLARGKICPVGGTTHECEC